MKSALHRHRNVEVSAARARHGEHFECPSCGCAVELRAGEVVDPYFAHYPDEGLDCPLRVEGSGSGDGSSHGRPYPEWVDDFCKYERLPPLRAQMEVEHLAAWWLLGGARWKKSEATLSSNLLTLFLLPELGLVLRRLMAALLHEQPDLSAQAATRGPGWLCEKIQRRVEDVDWAGLETYRQRMSRPSAFPGKIAPIDQRARRGTRGMGSTTMLTRKRGRLTFPSNTRIKLLLAKEGGRLVVRSEGEPDFDYYLLRRTEFPPQTSTVKGSTLSVTVKEGEGLVLLGHVGALGTTGRLNSLPTLYVVPMLD